MVFGGIFARDLLLMTQDYKKFKKEFPNYLEQFKTLQKDKTTTSKVIVTSSDDSAGIANCKN